LLHRSTRRRSLSLYPMHGRSRIARRPTRIKPAPSLDFFVHQRVSCVSGLFPKRCFQRSSNPSPNGLCCIRVTYGAVVATSRPTRSIDTERPISRDPCRRLGSTTLFDCFCVSVGDECGAIFVLARLSDRSWWGYVVRARESESLSPNDVKGRF
jgi:hypothetical protein